MSKREHAGRSDRAGRTRGSRTVSAGDALRAFLDDAGLLETVSRYRALTLWPEVVGPQIAAVTSAKRLEHGILFVGVTTAPWRAELTMRREEIARKINEATGSNVVKDIRFR
jgi:predicted nucleic acid-binding Zn ribbon protein